MRSLRTVYNAISSDPFSNRSGGIDGRPVALYMELKIGDSSLSTVSANCFTRLSGCSRGTRSSTFITINIDRCCRSSPRIRRFLLHCDYFPRPIIHECLSCVLQQPARQSLSAQHFRPRMTDAYSITFNMPLFDPW